MSTAALAIRSLPLAEIAGRREADTAVAMMVALA